jgi:hypothetical protein
LTTGQEIRHQAVIAGRVTQGQTGRPLSNALVMITAGPPEFTDLLALKAVQHGRHWESLQNRPDRTRSAADGHFHFLNLPDGQYTLEVSVPGWGSRYGITQAPATVSRNPDSTVNLATVNPVVQPTTIRGRVTNQEGDPVVMAAVQLQGSGERAYSDAQGNYRLLAVETGARTVGASASGFETVSHQVSLLEAGGEQVQDITLS